MVGRFYILQQMFLHDYTELWCNNAVNKHIYTLPGLFYLFLQKFKANPQIWALKAVSGTIDNIFLPIITEVSTPDSGNSYLKLQNTIFRISTKTCASFYIMSTKFLQKQCEYSTIKYRIDLQMPIK